jgi:site-specific DNA-adenine methylase
MRGWSEDDEKDLHSILLTLHKKGIRFALSNVMEHKGQKNDLLSEWVRKNNFIAHSINHDYRNSNYQSKAKNNHTNEVLITNF